MCSFILVSSFIELALDFFNYHTHDDFDIADPSSTRTRVIHEPSSVPARHESFVAQWLEHPTGGRKELSSVPIRNSVFSLSCARDMLITSFLIRIYWFFFPLIFSSPISLDIPFLIANVSCN